MVLMVELVFVARLLALISQVRVRTSMHATIKPSSRYHFLSIAPWDDFFACKASQSAKMIIQSDDICAAGGRQGAEW